MSQKQKGPSSNYSILDPDKHFAVYKNPLTSYSSKEKFYSSLVQNGYITNFEEEYSFLSSTYKAKVVLPYNSSFEINQNGNNNVTSSNVDVNLGGRSYGDFHLSNEDLILYPSVEHALQAAKTSDSEIRRRIREECPTAIDAKRFVSKEQLQKTSEEKEKWKGTSLQIMKGLLRDRFVRHRVLRDKLLETGSKYLIYQNTLNDTWWGMCSSASSTKSKSTNTKGYKEKDKTSNEENYTIELPNGITLKGFNYLGKFLMEIREDIHQGIDVLSWLNEVVQPAKSVPKQDMKS